MTDSKLEKKVINAMMNGEDKLICLNVHKPFAKSLRVLGHSGETMEDILKMLYNFYLKENEYICRMCGSGMTDEGNNIYKCINCGHYYNKNQKIKKSDKNAK
jgi:rubrerythrin